MKGHHSDPRAMAARALVQIVDRGQTLDDALHAIQASTLKALIQEMLYGVLRWFHRLDILAGYLLKQGLKTKDRDIHMLLLIGLYEFIYMDNAAYATVNETVSATKKLGKPWASGVLNACLRRFQREFEELQRRLDEDDQSLYSHPPWFIDLVRTQYPQHWQQILRANNQRPPMHLRVNTRATTRDDYLLRLAENKIDACVLPTSSCAIALNKAGSVNRLPDFDRGWVSVQDGAAQLSAALLDIQAGDRVLDACAAPGGKAAHMLERHADIGELVLVEKSSHRSIRIKENFQRLGISADIRIANAAEPDSWWDRKPFQRILLDAPCSATGVIRRHPDIKLHRKPQHIERAAKLQAKLLRALWPLLESGGKLLYATCSILALENQGLVANFLGQHDDCQEVALDLPWAQRCTPGYQILPGTKKLDGFYYACLQKQ